MAIPAETQWRNAAVRLVSPCRCSHGGSSDAHVTQNGASTMKVDTPLCLRAVFLRSCAVAFPVVVLLAAIVLTVVVLTVVVLAVVVLALVAAFASCLAHARVFQL